MTIEIPLSRGYIAIVDDVDADFLERKWSVSVSPKTALINRVYARTFNGRVNGRSTYVYLHRILLSRVLGRELSRKEYVDHIDRNPLNNRRSNLRLATAVQNAMNTSPRRNRTSKYKGVYYDKANARWGAKLSIGDNELWLGRYDTAEEAAIAYNHAALEQFKEFAYLNDVPEWNKRTTPLTDRRFTSSNPSGYPNIHYEAHSRKWRVRVWKNNKAISVGSFATLDDAVTARLQAIKDLGIEEKVA